MKIRLPLFALGTRTAFLGTNASCSAADARTNWNTHSAKCHAADGSGNTPVDRKLGVRDYRDPKVQAAMNERGMIKATRGGLKDKKRELMKPFGGVLTDDEIRDLITLFRSLKQAIVGPTSRSPPGAPGGKGKEPGRSVSRAHSSTVTTRFSMM
jgi:cytochrome c553